MYGASTNPAGDFSLLTQMVLTGNHVETMHINIEFSAFLFELDSSPAMLENLKSSFAIYSSNLIIVMGLKSLDFVVSEALKDTRFLEHSWAIVLVFIGIGMMLNYVLRIEIQVMLSLGLRLGIPSFLVSFSANLFCLGLSFLDHV